jgi:hypothetical protein
MNIEIIPFVGFGQIKFGMSLEQVKGFLGEPTENVREKHDDGTDDISWIYGELGAELSFMSEDDYRLGVISCYAPSFTLDGKAFNGMSEADFLKEASFDDLTMDEDIPELNAKDYTIDSLGLSMWIQDGVVDSITIFPRHLDEETVEWPE